MPGPEGRQERYELVEGRVVMMTHPRRAHAIIVTNLIVAFRRRLDSRKGTVIAEFGLDAGPRTLRFPDIVLDRIGDDLDDRGHAQSLTKSRFGFPSRGKASSPRQFRQ